MFSVSVKGLLLGSVSLSVNAVADPIDKFWTGTPPPTPIGLIFFLIIAWLPSLFEVVGPLGNPGSATGMSPYSCRMYVETENDTVKN